MKNTCSANEMNCSDALQQMLLFDLSRPKDITTFIEVEPDDRMCLLNKKRKSTEEKESKIKKKLHLTDTYEDMSQIEDDVSDDDNPPISHTGCQPLRTIMNRVKEYSENEVHADINNLNQKQMCNNKNIAQITNQDSSTIPPSQAPYLTGNVPKLNQFNYAQTGGLNVIVEQVLKFLSLSYCQQIESRQELFQRCYPYVVSYCLDTDMKNVFNYIFPNIVTTAQIRLQYINQEQTSMLLGTMFKWCRERRLAETRMEQRVAHNPPAYSESNQFSGSINFTHTNSSARTSTYMSHASPNNLERSSQINNPIKPTINNDDQTCVFMSDTHCGLSINIDTTLYSSLQYKTAKLNMSENIHERETPKLYQSPQTSDSGVASAFECSEKNTSLPHKNDYNNEIVNNQTELSRSSVSRDSGFISPSNVNNVEDRLICPTQPYTNDESSPIITHVTSLNNNASYISKGLCSVCKKETNKLCIGCYKRYYCGRDCQLLEWKIHKITCNNTH